MNIYSLCLVVGMVSLFHTADGAADTPDVPINKQGFLMYKEGGGTSIFGKKNWKKRYLFVFTDRIEYHTSKDYKEGKAKGTILVADIETTDNASPKIRTGMNLEWFEKKREQMKQKLKCGMVSGMEFSVKGRTYKFVFDKEVLEEVKRINTLQPLLDSTKKQEYKFSEESNRLKFKPEASSKPSDILSEFRKHEGNDVCADCSNKNPTWAVLPWGVLVCETCSGIFRNLDSKINNEKINVRSISLDTDTWNDKLGTKLLSQFRGNASVNYDLESIFKGRAADYKPDEKASAHKRTEWIKAKYSLQYTKPQPARRRRLATPIQRLDELIKSL